MVIKLNNSELIRIYRKRKNLTMKQLGEKVGVSEQAISQYERSMRTPNFITLQKICSVLNLSIDNFSGELAVIPTKDEIDEDYSLALNTQIHAYIDDIHRDKVKKMCQIFEIFNYEVEIDKDTTSIIDKGSNEIYMKIPNYDFIFISEMYFGETQGLIDSLEYRYNSNK